MFILGAGVGNVFLIMVPLALITLVTIALLPNIPLGTMTGIDRERSAADAEPTTGQIGQRQYGIRCPAPSSTRSASVEFDRDRHYARERSSGDNGCRPGSGRRAI
jgi:hypothetical protein